MRGPSSRWRRRLRRCSWQSAQQLGPQPLGLRGFIVIFGQAYNDAELRVVRGLRDALARERVAHFDYTGLFDPRDLQYRPSEFDHHNSARANRIVATRLIADLGGAW